VLVAFVACRSTPPEGALASTPLARSGLPAWLESAANRCAKISSCAHPHGAPRLRDPGACVDGWIALASAKDDPV
jgi:hypothetical protein